MCKQVKNGNCWDCTEDSPSGIPPVAWCDECCSIARSEASRAVSMMQEVEKNHLKYDECTRSASELMRWIVRHNSNVQELLSYRISQLERELDDAVLVASKADEWRIAAEEYEKLYSDCVSKNEE